MSILPVLIAWQPSLGAQVWRDLQTFVSELSNSNNQFAQLHLGQITITASAGARRERSFERIDASTRVLVVAEPDVSFMSFAILHEVQVEVERMLTDLRSSALSPVEAPMVIIVCSSEFTQDFLVTADSTLGKLAHLGGGPQCVRIFKVAQHGVGDGNFPDRSVGAITAETLSGVDAIRTALRQVVVEVVRRVSEVSARPEATAGSDGPVNKGQTSTARPTVVEPSRPTVRVEASLSSGSDRSTGSSDAEKTILPTSRHAAAGGPQPGSVSAPIGPPSRPTLFEPSKASEDRGSQSPPVAFAPPSAQSHPASIELSGESTAPDIRQDDPIEEAKQPKRRWWGRPKSEPSESDSTSDNLPEHIGEPATDPELPKPENQPKLAVDQRAVNGPLIVEFDSPLNRKVWHTDGWTKFPESGPSRDFECEYGNVGSLRVLAGSMRGTKHKYYGDPNQDAYAIRTTKEHVIIAVSDGVSSAKYSAYASKYLTDAVVRRVQNGLLERSTPTTTEIRQIVHEAVESASVGVSRWRDGELFAPDVPCETVDIRELAATLTVAVVSVEASQEKKRAVVVGFIGDSPCYLLNGLDWTIKTSESKTGDVIDHATSALPVREGRPIVLEWDEFGLGESESLLVMTDGIGTSLASGRSAVGRWMAPRITPLLSPQLESNFFDLISFDRNGEDDDRTLVVVLDVNAAEFVHQEGSHDVSQ